MKTFFFCSTPNFGQKIGLNLSEDLFFFGLISGRTISYSVPSFSQCFRSSCPPPLFKILCTLLFSTPKIETYRWSKILNFGYKPPLYSNSIQKTIQSLGCSPSHTLCAVDERKLATLFSFPFEHNTTIADLHMHGWGFALSFALMQVKQGSCECQFCRLWFDLTGNWIRVNR